MSLDLRIGLNLMIQGWDGMPFVHDGFGRCVPYDAQRFAVPEPFKKYINQHGPHWNMYIKPWSLGSETTCSSFLRHYPLWSVVYEGLENTTDWTEQDHDMFKAALTWFVEKGGFYVHWLN